MNILRFRAYLIVIIEVVFVQIFKKVESFAVKLSNIVFLIDIVKIVASPQLF